MSNPTRQEIEQKVADAINLDIKRQLNGQPNPPEGLFDATSWNAMGLEIDLLRTGQAALKALEQWIEIVPESQEPKTNNKPALIIKGE